MTVADEVYVPKDPVEVMGWMVSAQRSHAYNLGYLDVPLADEPLPEGMTWQLLEDVDE